MNTNSLQSMVFALLGLKNLLILKFKGFVFNQNNEKTEPMNDGKQWQIIYQRFMYCKKWV